MRAAVGLGAVGVAHTWCHCGVTLNGGWGERVGKREAPWKEVCNFVARGKDWLWGCVIHVAAQLPISMNPPPTHTHSPRYYWHRAGGIITADVITGDGSGVQLFHWRDQQR